MSGKKLIFFLSLISSITSSAQQINTYYKYVHEAEENLFQGHFKEASEKYKIAFSTDVIFPSDLRNAFKTALLAGKKRSIIFFWEKVKEFPELINSIHSDTTLVDYLPSFMLNKMQETSYMIVPPSLLDIITDSIFQIDQTARHNCPDNLKKTCIELFKVVDSSNISFLSRLLTNHEYTRKDLTDKIIYKIFIIALHARRFGYTSLDPALISYVKKGMIQPIWYAKLNAYNSDLKEHKPQLASIPKLGLGNYYLFINDTVLLFKQNDSINMIYNKNRKRIFMNSIENETRIAQFIYHHPFFKNSLNDFCIDSWVLQMPEKEAGDMINNYKRKKILVE